jgi:hypothetical protein
MTTLLGFKRANMTDHEFAAFLRKHDAVERFSHVANSVTWRDAANRAVAVAFYDNAASTHAIWVSEESK